MQTPTRYVLAVLGFIILLHSILSLTHAPYSRATSLSSLFPSSSSSPHSISYPPSSDPALPNFNPDLAFPSNTTAYERANATFVMLARNSDLDGVIRSMREAEDRFNARYGYPWVLLNDEPWEEGFIRRVRVLTRAPISFGVVPRAHWAAPDWIDEERAQRGREKMQEEGVIYGGSVSYRNMCRFNSGFFYKHELLQPYRYYWRVEPDVHFHCDIAYDPFMLMQREEKVYGFTITMYEFEATIPTLWSAVREFMRDHPEHVSPDNAMGFLSDNNGDTYNLCHYWSNFEIADMEFWRGPAYTAFFEFLDSKGGFYYERWGDAPVHSIAAALFARKDQIQFFDSIGYEHNPYTHCPAGDAWARGRCSCDPAKSFDYDGYSCLRKWDKLVGR